LLNDSELGDTCKKILRKNVKKTVDHFVESRQNNRKYQLVETRTGHHRDQLAKNRRDQLVDNRRDKLLFMYKVARPLSIDI